MFALRQIRRHRGAAAIEFAFVAPVALFLVFAQVVGGLGVSRYQEVAHLAREGARYASTHGGMYQREGLAEQTGVPAVAGDSELHSYLAEQCVLLDRDRLQVTVAWTAPNIFTPANMPAYVDADPKQVPPAQKVIQNNVIVTVTYQWTPEVFPIGSFTLTSTSQMPMSY
jgi:Flp pilus assembly protein TadG